MIVVRLTACQGSVSTNGQVCMSTGRLADLQGRSFIQFGGTKGPCWEERPGQHTSKRAGALSASARLRFLFVPRLELGNERLRLSVAFFADFFGEAGFFGVDGGA